MRRPAHSDLDHAEWLNGPELPPPDEEDTEMNLRPIATPGTLWVEVPGFPGLFVDYDGRQASVRSGTARILKGYRRGQYLALSASGGGPYAHQVVCDIFHGEKPFSEAEVRHINGNRDDNRAANLAWATHRENEADKQLHGTSPAGERNGMAKLSRSDVEAMRSMRIGGQSFSQIAKQFGISTMTAFRAVRGQAWK